MQYTDTVLRAMTDDGGFRVVIARTTETVRAALTAQRAQGSVAKALGELTTGAILVRETMAPKNRVQAILQASPGGSVLVADSRPDGTSRALVQRVSGLELELGEASVLQVMRTLPTGAAHKGTVAVPDERSVSSAMMAYLHASEQVTSAIAMGVVMRDGEVIESAGYLVQLLPELTETDLALMTARLETIPTIDALLGEGASPTALLNRLLAPWPHTVLSESPLGFGCDCNSERLKNTLATLSAEDLESLIAEGQPLEIECDWCHTEYSFGVDEVRSLLIAKTQT